jgi:hypothetical protein
MGGGAQDESEHEVRKGGSISRSGLEAQATLTVLVHLLSTDAVGESPL